MINLGGMGMRETYWTQQRYGSPFLASIEPQIKFGTIPDWNGKQEWVRLKMNWFIL